MKNSAIALCIGLVAVACTSRDVGPHALTAEEKAAEARAVQNAGCGIENQARCDHLIENRILFGRFFAPETLGGMDESEKLRGRRITTKFVVEAAAAIRQCNRVVDDSITIIKGMEINGGKFLVKGTSPLVQQSSTCFITPQPEES